MLRSFSNCLKGFSNVLLWMPLVWRDYDYHYGPLLEIMHFKLCKMADAQERNGYYVHRDRSARQMRMCASLCRRIHQDNYSEMFQSNAGQRLSGPEHAGRYRFREQGLEGLLMERDLKLLAYLLGKQLLNWWD